MAKRPNSARDGLSPSQKKALAALMTKPTKRKAAEAAGIGYTTLKRWLSTDKDFQEAYTAAQNELLEDALTQSKLYLPGSLLTLASIANDKKAPASARVAAARSSADLTLRLIEVVDITQKIRALEEWRESCEN